MNANTRKVFEILGKWRAHFAGWQLGTRSSEDPECQAVRDHREVTIMLRAQMNAMASLLIKKGVVTEQELDQMMALAAIDLCESYEKRWPGARATPEGMTYSIELSKPWMSKWKP